MDVQYSMKEYICMSASGMATLKKKIGVSKPSQSWPWIQKDSTVVAAVMILKLWTTEEACYR